MVVGGMNVTSWGEKAGAMSQPDGDERQQQVFFERERK
jgi:hypothetical protein